MTTNAAAAKIRFTREPPLPGKCANCGHAATGKEDFVDFDLSLDYYGAVVFCTPCSEEIARLLRFVPVALVEEAILTAENKSLEIEALNEKVQTLERTVAVYFMPDVVDSPTDGMAADEEPSETIEESVGAGDDSEDRFA